MCTTGIGPVSKWVDDHIFFRIPSPHLFAYNTQRLSWHKKVMANGGRIHEGSRLWYRGDVMPDGRPEEFDEDMSFPLRNLSSLSLRLTDDAQFTYADADIDRISNELGIPWEHSKTVPFSNVVPYLGFVWNLTARTVEVPLEKKRKYRNAIEEWQKKPRHTLAEVQKLYSKLLHTTLVVPAGRAYLTNLEAMLALFNNRPFMPYTPPRDTPHDLIWWARLLDAETLSRPMPSQAQFPSKIWMPSRMPVQDSASVSPSARSGGHGVYSQVGRQKGETSGGQKQSASSSSCSSSCHPAMAVSTSKSTEIIQEWSKAGGKVGVETSHLTSSSAASMPSWALGSLPSTRDMYQARKIQRTIPREEYILPFHSSYQSCPYPRSSTTSLSISTPELPDW
jgi:hypothetical protein